MKFRDLLNKTIKVMRLRGGYVPTYGTKESAGFDLYSDEDIEFKAGEFKVIKLGIAMEIPEGYFVMVAPRSSTYKNYGLRMTNSVGIIDADYRGEIGAMYIADKDCKVKRGERIAQGILLKSYPIVFEESTDLSRTERGVEGFGSTGR